MWQKILQSKWLVGVMTTTVVGFGFSVYKIQVAVNQVNKEAGNLKQKINEAEQAIAAADQLRENIKNQSYLEQLARLRLNFKQPDEQVVFVYRNRYNPDASADASLPAANPAIRWWQTLWQWWKEKTK